MCHRLTAAFITGLALWGGAAQAQVRLIEAGIVCPRISVGELVEAPGTEAGVLRRIREGLVFDLNARTVPTMDHLGFGFRTGLKDGAEAQEVTVAVTHPPMGPREIEREEWTTTLWPGESNMNLFTFEEDYEKVPGPWTFSIEQAGRTLVSVTFEVTRDSGQGAVEQACFRFMS
ncbi:DUF3859 domain-containing protein [Jannaschia sp. M317]|uniref:DUF3859 domain-containing protein n=1 Tax=Jannaschia sp. M317 TaxID=2867011 RepID=UPI0021A77C25|nr:DUF3859 domain-containing protein [Jannaschia sp. M317]UWQ17380.1 DUF3859 domain-containing protein [Jannaschia sp. M317]